MDRKIFQINEKIPILLLIPLCIQHTLAMFGASVLVPAIFCIDPGIVLLMNGVGTIGYILICDRRIPAFLGSSFAFIPPGLIILGSNKSLWTMHYQSVLGAFVVSGIILIGISFIIKFFGYQWLKIIFPPAVLGPIITLIGLSLSDIAAKMSGIIINPGESYDISSIIISMITFFTAFFGTILLRGIIVTIPILFAIIIGFISAFIMGKINLYNVINANFFILPHFIAPKFSFDAIITMVPAVFVVISEHIGHFILTQHIIEKNLMQNPGLHRSILGNGIFTMISGFLGSVPNTTYGENISVMALTKVYSIWVMIGAAIISILMSFNGKIISIIQSIPIPVMGGISLFLFGIISIVGIRYLITEKVDYNKNKNLILSATIFIFGISNTTIFLGNVQLKGVTLGAFLGIILSLSIHLFERMNITNEN